VLAALALILGGLAASDVSSREAAIDRRLGPPVPVVVARTDLAAGRVVRASDLALRQVPARYAPAAAFANPSEAAGLRTTAAVVRGTDLVPALLADDDAQSPGLRPGERVALVTAIAPIRLIRPGGRVDVVVTRSAQDADRIATTTLEDVQVLAAAPAGEDNDSGAPRVAVSLRVRPRQGVSLAVAQSLGSTIRLLPRSGP
jgi:pilus assembly protein CpaB